MISFLTNSLFDVNKWLKGVFKSDDMDEAMFKRYFKDASAFDKLAFWYGKKSIWIKLPVSLAIVAGITAFAALTASVFWAGIIAGITTGLMILANNIFQGHYDKTKNRCEKIKKDLVQTKESAQQEIDDLKAGIANQQTQIDELKKAQHDARDSVKQFGDNVNALTEVKDDLADKADLLNKSHQDVSQQKQHLVSSIAGTATAFESAETNIKKGSEDLRQTCADIKAIVGDAKRRLDTPKQPQEKIIDFDYERQCLQEHTEDFEQTKAAMLRLMRKAERPLVETVVDIEESALHNALN